MKSIQPICYCFLDEHETQAVRTYKVAIPTCAEDYVINFATPLHHHSILALDPITVDRMELLEGENTLNNGAFSHKIMTSDIRKCDAQTVLYASKMLKKYNEYMTFPDSLRRHHNKIRTNY